MTATVPRFRIRSAEDRVRFLASEASNHWVADRRIALEVQECESVVAEVNGLHDEISDLDCVLHSWFLDNDTFDEALYDQLRSLFAGWLNVARSIREDATRVAGTGHSVRGLEALSKGIREVAAALNPSYDMTPAMEALQDAAVAEHRAGRFVDGFID